FRESVLRHPESGERGGKSAIDRRLQQAFADLLAREPITQHGADVKLELMGHVERDQHPEVEHAPPLVRDARPRPDEPQGSLRGKLLYRHRIAVGVASERSTYSAPITRLRNFSPFSNRASRMIFSVFCDAGRSGRREMAERE